ncbi:MAG: hypothetical protein JKX94_11440, partial [Sneathiella sp.]|nr:hypothetical protein [Sneathiella sp.]
MSSLSSFFFEENEIERGMRDMRLRISHYTFYYSIFMTLCVLGSILAVDFIVMTGYVVAVSLSVLLICTQLVALRSLKNSFWLRYVMVLTTVSVAFVLILLTEGAWRPESSTIVIGFLSLGLFSAFGSPAVMY